MKLGQAVLERVSRPECQLKTLRGLKDQVLGWHNTRGTREIARKSSAFFFFVCFLLKFLFINIQVNTGIGKHFVLFLNYLCVFWNYWCLSPWALFLFTLVLILLSDNECFI